MNVMETVVANRLEEVGWEVLRGGWPDFLCIRKIGDEWVACCIEVKAGYDKLSVKQAHMHQALSRLGMRTLVISDPEVERFCMPRRLSARVPTQIKQEVSRLAREAGKCDSEMTAVLLQEGLTARQQEAVKSFAE